MSAESLLLRFSLAVCSTEVVLRLSATSSCSSSSVVVDDGCVGLGVVRDFGRQEMKRDVAFLCFRTRLPKTFVPKTWQDHSLRLDGSCILQISGQQQRPTWHWQAPARGAVDSEILSLWLAAFLT
eukprot:168539-Rhodomonas_salina.1